MDCLLNGLPSGNLANSVPSAGPATNKGIEVTAAHHGDGDAKQQSEPGTDGLTDLQQRNFQSVHEVLAERASAAWSQKLRGNVDVRVTKIGRPNFGEFSFGLDNPTCFLTLHVPPFTGGVCLEIHPTLLFPMIDRLLGGGKKAGPIVRRPLTEIERRLLTRLVEVFFAEFRSAWRPFAIVAPEIKKIESNPKLSRCAPPSESVESIEFEVAMPFARGPMRLAYPSSTLEAVYDHLAGTCEHPLGVNLQNEHEFADVRVILAERPIDVELTDFKLTSGEIMETGVTVGGHAELQINGVSGFVGQIGQHNGMKAIRIE